MIGNSQFVKAATLDNVYQKATAAARANGGPLGYLEISSHGVPGTLQFSDGKGGSRDIDLAAFLTGLRRRGVVAPGSVLHLGGCNIAGNKYYNRELSELAKAFGITIIASRLLQAAYAPGFDLFVFRPNGKVDYQPVKIGR